MKFISLNIILMVALLFLISPEAAFATSQDPDNLVYKGEILPIFSNPLESYWNTKNPVPENVFFRYCSAVWRGYVATWKIENGYLYLTKIVEGTCIGNPKEIPISKIFPDQKTPIKATWFNGIIRIPQGKLLKYVHMGYQSVYEKELLLTIKNGEFIKENIMDHTHDFYQKGKN